MKKAAGRSKPSPPTSARADGRGISTAHLIELELAQLQPRLAFDPAMPAAQFPAWQKRVRARLRKLLAFPRIIPQPAPRLLETQPRDGYDLQRWELYPQPGCALPVLLLAPHGLSARRRAGAVLCLPGSDHPKELLAGEPNSFMPDNPFGEHQFMARHLAQRGLVALAMDNPATAQLADPQADHWARHALPLIWMGRNYEGISTFQKLQALRWLKTLPFVDRRRLAVCGHSLGAKPALLLGLLDPAVRAVVFNSAAMDWKKRHQLLHLTPWAPWQYVPGMIQWFDYLDLMCALAPTPLLISEGGRSSDLQRIARAYSLLGARAKLATAYMPGFARAAQRRWDNKPLPAHLDAAGYARYHNLDEQHYFKDQIAVPWLCAALGLPAASAASPPHANPS